ncbi:MAG: hypothetical protein KF773_20320 [Deltaproteobacteria bacterium]|nr:hypothetical protein [Deltaproteobacteria bacterium]
MTRSRFLCIAAVAVSCGTPAVAPKTHRDGSPPPKVEPALVPTGDWQKAPTEAYRGKQDDLYFVSPTVGFYGNGAGKIFRTDDAGATWQQVLEQKGTFVRALGFLDEQRGFAGNIGPDSFPGVTDETLLYRTTDGGRTWAPVALPPGDGARGVCAIDILTLDTVDSGQRLRKEIVHVGGRVNGPASLFASDDGGATWRRLALPPSVAMILDVKFLDPSIGFLFAGTDPDSARSHGLIAKTSDGGRTWRTVYQSARPHELMWKGHCPTRRTCYATLQNYSVQAEAPDATPKRFVVKTEDGGDTWRELPLVEDPKVQEFGVAFVDERRGWVGAAPTGFATADGGATWTPAAGMPLAANKLRIVHDRDGAGATVWAIGVDVRSLRLAPAPAL